MDRSASEPASESVLIERAFLGDQVAAIIVLCLSMADMLEGWHYTLIAAESVLVGYQISVM